jgi:hypothetical protein
MLDPNCTPRGAYIFVIERVGEDKFIGGQFCAEEDARFILSTLDTFLRRWQEEVRVPGYLHYFRISLGKRPSVLGLCFARMLEVLFRRSTAAALLGAFSTLLLLIMLGVLVKKGFQCQKREKR